MQQRFRVAGAHSSEFSLVYYYLLAGIGLLVSAFLFIH